MRPDRYVGQAGSRQLSECPVSLPPSGAAQDTSAPGKHKNLAGSETGMGAWVNDTTPERIAPRQRAVAPE